MHVGQNAFLGWSSVAIATLFMLLASGLMLYPGLNADTISTALRLSSVTTALPFLLVFVARPLAFTLGEPGHWLQANRRYLWLILTISHLIHLYQIALYYQLGQSCPLTVWLVTAPLWIMTVAFSLVELMQPQRLDNLNSSPLSILYGISYWYIWLVFVLAFALSAAANHIPFYNVPALVLYLAGAVLALTVSWRKRRIS